MKQLFIPVFFLCLISAITAQNVGIGTQSPAAKLEVVGAVRVDSFQNVHSPGVFLEWNKDSISGETYLLNHKGIYPGGFILGEVDNFNTVTPRMRIDGNGNVGIGTNPTATLDVARGSGMSGTAVFRGSVFQSHFNYDVSEDTYLRGGKPTSNVIINDLCANVGIGTSSPSNKLSVLGNADISDSLGIGTNNPASARLVISGSAGAEGLDLSSSDQYANLRVLHNSMGASDHDMYFGYGSGVSSTLHFYADNNESMTLKNGKLGIGTNAPSTALEVAGQITGTSIKITSGSANGLYLKSDAAGNGSWANFTETDPEVSSSGLNKIPKWNGTTLIDGTIIDNGNIGIGATPVSKLDVEGGVSIGVNYSGTTAAPANGIIIEGNAGIGTTTPASKLDVEGGVSIGATYSGTTAAPTNGLIIEGNAGIGTTTPASKLDVEGGVSIGATYSGSTAAPTNGLIIEGKTGIGTTTPASKLDVEGGVSIGATYSGSTAAPTNGLIIEGKVGIGKTNPTKKLDVQGDVIIYTDASTSEPLQVKAFDADTSLDQSNPINGSGCGAGNGNIWQSFTAGTDGKLAGMMVTIGQNAVWSGTWTVYSGTGTSGSVLATGTYNYPAIGGAHTVYIPIPSIPYLTAGSVYTFRMSNIDWVLSCTSNPYPGGLSNDNPAWDRFFQTFMYAPSTGLIVLGSNGNVGMGVTTPVSKLDVKGGVSIGAAYSGTTAAPTNGLIIQGKAGIGRSNPTKKLEVQGDVAIYPDGATIEPLHVNAFSTDSVLDQSSWPASSCSVSPGDDWQSFTAGIDGKLVGMNVFVNLSTSYGGTWTLYAGTGTGGTVLATGSYFFPSMGGAVSQYISITGSPYVTTGSVYTFRMSNSNWSVSCNGDSYPGGLSDGIPTMDRIFQTFVIAPASALVINGSNGNVGIGKSSPTTTLDVEGGIRSKYSGTYVSGVLTQNLVATLNITISTLPAGWTFTNTLVLASDSDGELGTILQAKVLNSTTIQVKFIPSVTGQSRINYIIFKL